MSLKYTFLMITLFSAPTFSQETSTYEVSDKPVREINLNFGLGYQALFQRSAANTAYENSRSYPSVVLGMDYRSWSLSLEWAQFNNQTETGNLLVSQDRTNMDFWLDYLPRSQGSWSPVVGASLGVYTDQVSTRFGDDTINAKSSYLTAAAVKAGLRWKFLNLFYADIDLRLTKRETSPHVEWATHTSLGFRL